MKNAAIVVVLALLCLIRPAWAHKNYEPYLLRFTDDVANTAGLGLLRESPIPEGETEIRIWLGFGMTVRQHLLRLFISTDEKVKGDVFIYYANGSHYMKEHGAKFLRKLKLGCENFRRGTHLDVCAATFRLSPDWHEIYNNLNSLGIKTLPDQSELPGAEIYVTDGTSVVIEVRDGARYRSYEYSNPSVRSEPEASRASEIIRIVENLVSQTNGT